MILPIEDWSFLSMAATNSLGTLWLIVCDGSNSKFSSGRKHANIPERVLRLQIST